MPSNRFRYAFPRFIEELEYFLAVERADEAGHLLRDIRQQPYFEQIDTLANAIHPAVFAELKKRARAVSFHKLIRRRSSEFSTTYSRSGEAFCGYVRSTASTRA